MKRLSKKVYFIIAGILIVIGLHILIFMPNKTDRLINAIEANDVAKVNELLETGLDPNRTDKKPSVLWSFLETAPRRPLSIACDEGNIQIVQLLIDYGATAEYVKRTGWSPLRATLFYYHPDDVEIVKLLLEHGATPNDVDDMLPVFVAAKMIPKVFDAQKTNGTVFSTEYDQETAEGIAEIVMILLGDNSVNITNSSGQTLLMVAVKAENIHLVECLLDRGCDPGIVDKYGKTALDYALELGYDEIAQVLSEK